MFDIRRLYSTEKNKKKPSENVVQRVEKGQKNTGEEDCGCREGGV